MNLHSKDIDRDPTRAEAEAALDLLRRWSTRADAANLQALDGVAPDLGLSQEYPADFKVTRAYKASMPDLQNGPASTIAGAAHLLEHVGISNFRMPLQFQTRDHGPQRLETSVTGTVSLEADKKGINISRIMRSFYEFADDSFDFAVIEKALDAYKSDLESFDARILLKTSFPLQVPSLRSGLSGYQYYDTAFEVVEQKGTRLRILHLDYVYSSTCPCSLELAEHARRTRGQLATPHSQRSVARISLVLDPAQPFFVDDLIAICRKMVPTETQVMVKREDEQAFAELNAANPMFVEDAARLFCEGLQADPRIGDFRVLASHQESLHSHDAVSVLTHGPTFASQSLDPNLFSSLVHTG